MNVLKKLRNVPEDTIKKPTLTHLKIQTSPVSDNLYLLISYEVRQSAVVCRMMAGHLANKTTVGRVGKSAVSLANRPRVKGVDIVVWIDAMPARLLVERKYMLIGLQKSNVELDYSEVKV